MSTDSQSTERAATPICSSTVSDRDVIVTNNNNNKNWMAQSYKQGFMNDLHGFFS